MLNVNWDAVQTITSPYSTIPINEVFSGLVLPSGNYALYQTAIDGYQIVPGKFRPVVDSLSQMDGASIQPPYIDGMVATFTLKYLVSPTVAVPKEPGPACGADLVTMNEILMGALNSLRAYPSSPDDGVFTWDPPGALARSLVAVMLGAWPEPDLTAGPPLVKAKVVLASPYPYANDGIVSVTIGAGSNGNVINSGNTTWQGIVQINGPVTNTCVVTNTTTGMEIAYNAGLPGASAIASGHSVYVDTFYGTAYLDGNPANDYIAGIDPSLSDWWGIPPDAVSGECSISVTGGTSATVEFGNAWC